MRHSGLFIINSQNKLANHYKPLQSLQHNMFTLTMQLSVAESVA